MPARLPLLWSAALVLVLSSFADAGPPERTDTLGDPLPEGAVARFGSARLRHVGPALALAWSPDGLFIASSGRDYAVRLWDAATGRFVRSFPAGKAYALCLAFTPDGKALVAGLDGAARVWDAGTGKELLRLDALNAEERRRASLPAGGFGEGWLPETRSVAVSPDGWLLAAGGSHPAMVWGLRTGEKRFAVGEGWTPHVAFTPDGKHLVTGDLCKAVRTWDARTGKPTGGFEVEGPKRSMNLFSLALSTDNRHAALKLLEQVVIVERTSGNVVWREKAHGYRDEPVAFSPDGRLFAFADEKSVRVWEWARGRQVAAIDEGREMWRRGCAFAPDGKRLAWTGWDGNVRIWDLAGGKEAPAPEGHRGGVALLALRPDGKAFATTDQAGTLRLWETASGRVARTVSLGDRKWYGCLGFSRGGRALVLGDHGSGTTVVDLAREEEPRSRRGPVENGWLIALGPGGETAVATDGNSNLTHLVFDTGRDWRAQAGPPLKVYYAAFTPDGKRLIVSGWDYLACLDAATGRERWRAEGNFNTNFFSASLAGSPDGRLVAAGCAAGQGEKDGGCVKLYDADTGREQAKLPTPHFRVTAAAISPDSRFVIAASTPDIALLNPGTDETRRTFPVSLWEVATGGEVGRFLGHGSAVCGLAFAPDGRTFYSASDDGTVLRWDAFGLRNAAAPVPAEGQALWEDLAGLDAAKAYRSAARLAASPSEACALFGRHLKPARPVSPERLAELIRELDSDRFAAREAAARDLKDLGEQADGALRQALERDPSPEVRRRIAALLEERRVRPFLPDELQRRRAVLVLEWIGSGEGRRLLEMLARGTAAVSHVRDARAVLRRLEEQATDP